MRKLILGLVAGTTLALGSAANAAVTVTGATGLAVPNPTTAGSVVVSGGTTTINFGQAPLTNPFSGSFTFTNTLSGLYSILIGSSSPGVTFTSASLTGTGGTTGTFTLTPFPDNTQLHLIPTQIVAGNYMFNFVGNAPGGGALTGNVTITAAAVPELATWAMMIAGFAGIGLTMRRRRRPALSQLA
jgi:hypothetical protein